MTLRLRRAIRNRVSRLLAVSALLPLLMGYACGGGGAGSIPPQGTILFDFETWNVRVGKPMTVTILVSTSHDFHSFDIDIQGPSQNALLLSAGPSEPFDDNGLLFVEPTYHVFSGEIRRIVDFRHGPSSAVGPIAIAEFTMIPHTATPAAELNFTKILFSDLNGVDLNISPTPSTFAIRR